MSINTCSNCRFNEDGNCLRTISINGEPIDPTSKMIAYDGESYYAVLHVSPDFGCMQFELDIAIYDRLVGFSERFMKLYGENFIQRFGGCNGVVIATSDSADLLQQLRWRLHHSSVLNGVLVKLNDHYFAVPSDDIINLNSE